MESKLIKFGHENIEVYPIPEYPGYHISKCGNLYSDSLGHCIKPWRNNGGYYYFNLPEFKIRYAARHRLLCRVFKPIDGWEKLYINHKNSIRGDDDLDNLEWVTPRENVHHAGEKGMTQHCIPVLVMDADTREIVKYPSMTTCAELTGQVKDAIIYRVRTDGQIIWPDRKLYKSARSETPWLDFKNEDIEYEIKRCGKTKPCLLRQLPEGEILTFDDQNSLARYLDIGISACSVWLNKPGQPVCPGFVQLKYLHDETPWREVNDMYLELQQTDKNRRIIVADIAGEDELKIYTSLTECARAHHLKTTTLLERLRRNKTTRYPNGAMFYYYDSQYSTRLSPHRVTEE